MKQTTMRNALGFRKSFAVRKLERGSVVAWIIILILLAATCVPIIMSFSHTLSDPAPGTKIIRIEDYPYSSDLDEELPKAQDLVSYLRPPERESADTDDCAGVGPASVSSEDSKSEEDSAETNPNFEKTEHVSPLNPEME